MIMEKIAGRIMVFAFGLGNTFMWIMILWWSYFHNGKVIMNMLKYNELYIELILFHFLFILCVILIIRDLKYSLSLK